MHIAQRGRRPIGRIIAAASIGTAFEWYDFFLFGTLASVLASHFFSAVSPSTGFLLALATFAAAPLMRPVGALLFGRLGDRSGRKRSFVITVLLMGSATFAIGLLPTYAQAGAAAPVLLVLLRLIQGLALGGEYGGAATYVAEHAESHERGWLTSWIQSSAAFGLIGAIGITLLLRLAMSGEAFDSWGWRLPFLASAAILALSLWMRLNLAESPVFQDLEERSETSRAPLKEAFLEWKNLKRVLLVLAGVTAAQGAVWYTAFFYTQFFMERVLRVDASTVGTVMLVAAAASVFLYLFFGWLSDRIGRKPVMLFGMGLAALAMLPGFQAITRAGNPGLAEAQLRSPVTVTADPAQCSTLFDPIGRVRFDSGCDIARRALADLGASYRLVEQPGRATTLRVGTEELKVADGGGFDAATLRTLQTQFSETLASALQRQGYPRAADPAAVDFWSLLALVMIFVVAASALYGPQAAWLVEMFPARIRYSAMSLPLHIGGGWFGGLLPAVAFALVAATGDIYGGLWWPMLVAATGFATTLLFLPETLERRPKEESLAAPALSAA